MTYLREPVEIGGLDIRGPGQRGKEGIRVGGMWMVAVRAWDCIARTADPRLRLWESIRQYAMIPSERN